MRIIIHFGMFKTGSTSIQETLYQNRANLMNIYYPNFGKPAHSLILSSAFRGKQSNPLLLSKLKKELDFNINKDCDILLSSEALTNFKFNELKSLHSMLSCYTKNIIAVGYIRSPKAYIESIFQEKLKALGIASFNIHQQFPKYQVLFEKFDQIFGKENVYFWNFDPLTFPDGCVVRDFCQKLSIDISPDSIVKVNEGLSLGAISFLYAYSKYKEELKFDSISRKELNPMIHLLSQLQGKKLRFASEIIAPILESNRSEINWMETRMEASLAENITKDDHNAIHSEAELLTFSPESIQWLAQQLGEDYVQCRHSQMMAKQIAKWVDMLRFKLSNPSKEIEELIHNAKKAAPHLETVADAKAILLIQEVFKQMISNIENTNQSSLIIAGLGRFKIHNINHTEEQKIASKQIIFEAQ
jgi:hypothetical protein